MNATTMDGYPASFLNAVPYHYVPTEWKCALILALFALSTLIHLFQGIWFHMWWTLPTAVLAGLGESIGWTARLWSSQNPTLMTPFLMQISSTIISPTLLVATDFIILAYVIRRLGTQYSRFSPIQYSILFCFSDLMALSIQAVGGASAAVAAQNNTDSTKGGHIMLGGIFFQMFTLTIYVLLAAEFVIRYNMNKPVRRSFARPGRLTQRLKLQLTGLCLMIFFVYIRSVYRTVELINGWDGIIISTEWLFNAWDGGMIILAMFTLNLFHPGILLNEPIYPADDLSFVNSGRVVVRKETQYAIDISSPHYGSYDSFTMWGEDKPQFTYHAR